MLLLRGGEGYGRWSSPPSGLRETTVWPGKRPVRQGCFCCVEVKAAVAGPRPFRGCGGSLRLYLSADRWCPVPLCPRGSLRPHFVISRKPALPGGLMAACCNATYKRRADRLSDSGHPKKSRPESFLAVFDSGHPKKSRPESLQAFPLSPTPQPGTCNTLSRFRGRSPISNRDL